jgi:dual specificity tyrosine-phosphorylation-regulated kinase 2/3/4
MSGHQALHLKSSILTDYESIEIQNYPKVYFIGGGANKIIGSTQNAYNFGYDDDRGDYNIVMKDHIGYRYELLESLGSGSFGQAIKCFDHKR